MEIGIIGLERVYNGKPKLITLINPKNLNLEIQYFDSQSNIIQNPIEIGEYKVSVKNQDINITKKLIIRGKEEVLFNNPELKNFLKNKEIRNHKKNFNNILLRLI